MPRQWARGPRIRPIQDADWERIAEIEHEAYVSLGLSEGLEALRAWGRVSPETCFALEADGCVAGYVIAVPHPAGSAPTLGRPATAGATQTTNLHLHDLALSPAHRGKGLARLLLRRLEQAAVGRGFETIGLVAVGAAPGFWAASGFAPQPDVAVSESYGTQAMYMARAVEVDQLAASA
ncbi:MAG: GNAT family N-acetyltransferase [Catenulispora sp.]